ncbi:hypothetical protein HZB74_02620 [Candidatus Saccharibacteria bacterium]|nr:hypothetical protein [Candidatus Saccharibacteria bacterium]
MTDPESWPNSIEPLISGLEMPADLAREFEELDVGGWNRLVKDLKERQELLESFGDNGTIGWQALQNFQNQFNSLDPCYVSRERRFGLVDIAFDGFIVERIDESGQESVELKTPINGLSTSVVRAARCDVNVYSLNSAIGGLSATLLCLKLEEIFSEDREHFDGYFADGTAGLYIPAGNLLEI